MCPATVSRAWASTSASGRFRMAAATPSKGVRCEPPSGAAATPRAANNRKRGSRPMSVCPGVRRGNGGRSGVGPALTMGCRVRWYLLSGTWFLFKLLSFAGWAVGNLVRTERCESTETAKRCG